MSRLKTIKGHVSINRDSRDIIKISVVDEASRAQFLEIHLTPENFAMAVTGLSHMECDMEVRKLDVVGKKKYVEQRVTYCPLSDHNRTILGEWLLQNAQETGWIIDTYLGSQNSISRAEDGKGQNLRYSVYRYGDAE